MANNYENTSVYDEAIRTLRTNIQFSNVDNRLSKLVITSSLPDEGKSTISIKLGRSFAQTGAKVIIVDCDLRNPSLGVTTGIENNIGLTNILLRKSSIQSAIINDEVEKNLSLILSGPIPPNPAELLSSNSMKALVEELDKFYDFVILDTPPAGIITDAAILSTITDGVILVVKSESTKKEIIRGTIEKIQHVGGKVIGAVMTHVKVKGGTYGKYYGQYYGKKKV